MIVSVVICVAVDFVKVTKYIRLGSLASTRNFFRKRPHEKVPTLKTPIHFYEKGGRDVTSAQRKFIAFDQYLKIFKGRSA